MDTVSAEKRSEIMSHIRSESGIEQLPDSLKGMHLRKHPKGIIGHPDFANKLRRIAVFIDGCFWHGCPMHYRMPKSNVEFWRRKYLRNTARDVGNTRALLSDGWRVIRVWEHDNIV